MMPTITSYPTFPPRRRPCTFFSRYAVSHLRRRAPSRATSAPARNRTKRLRIVANPFPVGLRRRIHEIIKARLPGTPHHSACTSSCPNRFLHRTADTSSKTARARSARSPAQSRSASRPGIHSQTPIARLLFEFPPTGGVNLPSIHPYARF